jgi:hypothetical protein
MSQTYDGDGPNNGRYRFRVFGVLFGVVLSVAASYFANVLYEEYPPSRDRPPIADPLGDAERLIGHAVDQLLCVRIEPGVNNAAYRVRALSPQNPAGPWPSMRRPPNAAAASAQTRSTFCLTGMFAQK